ncbi:unnamed protein product [Urochloa humidicola]
MAEAIVGPLVGKLQELAVSEAKALVAVNDDIRGLRDRLMWMQAFLRHADPRRRDTSDELIRVWLKQTRDVAFDAEDAIDDYSLKVDLSRDVVQPSPIKREKMGNLEEALFSDNMNRVIVCVTGEGGVGKSTLVRELYERPTTKSKFKHLAWVSFPPYLSSSSILQLIHQQLEEREDWCHRKYVEKKLHDKLEQVQFLLVIDGEVSHTDWNAILAVIPDSHCHSRIVRIMQGTHKRLHGISSQHWIELQCFDRAKTTSLFNQRVCMEEKTEGQIEIGSPLENVLLAVTKGLPLAIVLLSGLIQTKEHPNEWQAVFDYLESKKSKRLDAILSMCFDDLPHELKSCFLYFAALPMNKPIEARKLVFMWMAEGFLRPKDGKTMEKVGRIYLNELIIRHLVVKSVKMDNVSVGDEFVVVHHKVHEFLQHEAQEANFVDIHSGDDIPSSATTRCLSLQNYTDKYAALDTPLPKLRSILSDFQEEVEDGEEDEDCEEDEYYEDEDLEEEGDTEGEQNIEDDGDEEKDGQEAEVEDDGPKENVPYVDNEDNEEDEEDEIIEEGWQNERSEEEAKHEVKPSAMPLYNLLRCWEMPLSGLLQCCGEQSSPRDSIQSYIKDMLRVSKFLRVINLQGIDIGDNLPETIGNVAHLQYLGVTSCDLRYIPSTIENLKTLQTLDVRNTYVYKLPEAFWNITTLRHVFGSGLFLPKKVGNLKHLQTLESIDPDEKHGWDSNTFDKMVHLQSLHVSDYKYNGENAKALSAVIEKANFLEYLDTLALDVSSIPLSVFISSSLRCLRTLDLKGKLDMSDLPSNYKDSKFYFPNLIFLSLAKTEVSQDFISKLGKLPLLAYLILDTDSYVDDQGQLVFHAGCFKSLTKLTLSDLENLKKLEIEKSALPELTDLEVVCYPDDIKIEVHGEREFVKKIQEEDKFLYGCIKVSVATKKIGQHPSMKQRVAAGTEEVHR